MIGMNHERACNFYKKAEDEESKSDSGVHRCSDAASQLRDKKREDM